MTLIYKRESAAAQTHALIIGVGSFPHLKGQNAGLMEKLRNIEDVTSPPANARAMTDWMIKAADRLVPEPGSIELLISETDHSDATYPVGPHTPAGRQDDKVERATGDNISRALGDWVSHAGEREDNSALFYASSHGMQAQEHVLLLEDAGEDENDPWRNMLSLNHLHRNLYKKTNKRSLLFADCCRDLFEGGAESLDGFSGRRIGNITQSEYVQLRSQVNRFVYLLRACPPGAMAKATKNGLGYFTSAMLKCFEGGAGARKPIYDWCILPNRLQQWVADAGHYGMGIDDEDLQPQVEDLNWDDVPILRLEGAPKYPVRVREADPIDIGMATVSLVQASTAYREERDPTFGTNEPLCAWAPPSFEDYQAGGEIAAAGGTPAIPLETVSVPVMDSGHKVQLGRANDH